MSKTANTGLAARLKATAIKRAHGRPQEQNSSTQGCEPSEGWIPSACRCGDLRLLDGSAVEARSERMLADAKSGSDHEMIAQYYQAEADEAEAKYTQHEASAAQYRCNLRWGGWTEHCEELAQDYKNAQKEASWLAAHHRKIAEEMNSADKSGPATGRSNGGQDH